MIERTYRLEIRSHQEVTVKVAVPDGVLRAGIVMAHGMTNDLDYALLVELGEYLAGRGFLTVRFNFPYREAGRDRVDSIELLLDTMGKVAEDTKTRWGISADRIIIGGKSLGARVAARAAGLGLETAGLIYLGFPLHPPGRPEKSRVDLITGVGSKPQLFIAGDRDHLCPLDKLRAALNRTEAPTGLHVIPGGDHSFIPPEGDPRTMNQIHTEIVHVVGDWLEDWAPAR